MNKSIFFFSLMIFLISCNTHSSDSIDELNYKQYVLAHSIETIKQENQFIYKDFAFKLSDPMSETVAGRWSSKINEANSRSIFMNKFIDSVISLFNNDETPKKHNCRKKLVQNFFQEKYLTNRLYDSLINYRERMLQIDEESKKIFANEITIPLDDKLTSISKESFFRLFFKDKCQSEVLNNLLVFQNAFVTLENKYATFLNLKSTYHRNYYDVFSAIIGQSSTIVTPGEEFTVTAGIGAFSVAANPYITIDGEKQQIDDYGVLNKEVKASSVLGKHSFPVIIEYTEADGRRITKIQNIKYQVVKAIEQ